MQLTPSRNCIDNLRTAAVKSEYTVYAYSMIWEYIYYKTNIYF
jgi:hypothetical protein